MRRRALAAAILILLTPLSACSDDDEPDHAAQWSVAGELRELPRSVAESGLWVVTADLDGALRTAKLTRTGDDLQWLAAVGGMPVDGKVTPIFVPIGSGFNVEYAASGDFAAQAGWSLQDVDSFVEGGRPPSVLTVARGDFDKDTLNKDLVEVGDGIVSNSTAPDGQTDLKNTNGFSPLGQPIRLSEEGGRIALSSSTPLVQAWREQTETLAEDERAVALARALDDEEVLSAVLSQPVGLAGLGGKQLSPGTPGPIQQAFDGVGIGWGTDDGVAEIHVVYHFAGPGEAEAAAEPLATLWREGVSVRDGRPFAERVAVDDVEVEDGVVRIELGLQADSAPQVVYQMLLSGEPVFAAR
ncbi:hypothetical protein ACLM5J_15560 [Nocardioides sp. Bht2]|uniref:hypothetical protein n=1 Tax=Nocardioides sp. Bht2 TaxID=3392297 RepID=UPI0039B55BA0